MTEKGIDQEKLAEIKNSESSKMLEDAKNWVEQGLNLNDYPKSSEGATMLHIAASKDYVHVARYILDHGANPNAVENDGYYPSSFFSFFSSLFLFFSFYFIYLFFLFFSLLSF